MAAGDAADADETAILAEVTNPFGNLVAVLEDDGRTTYLYVHHTEQREWGFKALWVGNRGPAPEALDHMSREAGVAPRMSRGSTRHPDGTPPLRPDAIELVWTEEGDGVVLVYEGELVAALVPDADEACRGFARDALGRTAWAWEMTPDVRAALEARVAHARATWARWSSAAAWNEVQTRTLAHLEARLGRHVEYFAAGGERFPPLGIARFARDVQAGVSIYATVGMSSFPMPRVGIEVPDAAAHRRVEIVLATEGEPSWATSVVAWLARFPWMAYTWLGEGHTVLAPTAHATWFVPDQSAIFLTTSPPPDRDVAAPDLGGLADAGGDPVTYLWAVPITMDERKIAQLRGRAGLLERLPSRGKGFVFRE